MRLDYSFIKCRLYDDEKNNNTVTVTPNKTNKLFEREKIYVQVWFTFNDIKIDVQKWFEFCSNNFTALLYSYKNQYGILTRQTFTDMG